METTQKDHIFTEIYIGIHSVMVLVILVYYIYSQTIHWVMTLMLVCYGIYVGFELYLFATRQILKLENMLGGYLQNMIDILFISICCIYLDNYYYMALPIFCWFIIIASLANHRTKGVIHGAISTLGYLLVGILNSYFSLGVVLFQGAILIGFSFFVGELNQLINDVYKRNHYAMEEIEYKNQLLEYRATTDFLTDLSNHQAFYQSLEVIAEKHAPITLILLDIDDFKVVNDVYGHLSGDYVIREVSQVIKQQLRTSDIGARYGGEEFAVLLPGTGEPFGQRIAERICKSVAEYPFEFDHQKMKITLSAGVCHSTVALNQREQTMLVDQADELLYCSKRNGKNRVTSAQFK
jgi:diguanylate cyclase (GGDEF)-like protein